MGPSGLVTVHRCTRTLADGSRQYRDCQLELDSVSLESYATTEYLRVPFPLCRGVGGAEGRLLTLTCLVQRTCQ
jgi:hypothetical protein